MRQSKVRMLKNQGEQYAKFREHVLGEWHDANDHSAAKCSKCEMPVVVWYYDQSNPVSGEAVFFNCEGGK
jgi:hypothetical protein